MQDQAIRSASGKFHPDHPLAIASFVLLGTIGVLSFIVQPALVQGFVTLLHLTEAQAVDLAGIEMAGVALVTVVLAFTGNLLDWRNLTMLFLMVAAAGNFASAMATEGGWLSTARFVTGLGEGGIISLSFSFVGLTRRTDFNLGIYLVVLLAYGALGVWQAPWLFATVGLKGIFLFFAVVTLLSLVTLPFLPRSSDERHGPEHQPHAGPRSPRVILLVALAGVLIYNLAQGIAWANLFLIGMAADLQEQTVANALFISQVVAVGGALAAIVLAERIGRLPIFVVGVLGGATCIALLLGKPASMTFLIAVCGFNFLWNMVQPFILGAVNELDHDGLMMRAAIAMQMIGLGGGPILSARLIGDGQFTAVEWVCIGCFLVSFAMLVVPLRQRHVRNVQPHAPFAEAD
ncbi:MAG: MFS transporter [Sphingorhabdus sp.]